jgi:hypothetical protein
MSANKWAVIALSVDTVKGETMIFVNGKTLCAVRSANMFRDGPFALASTIALFGAKDAAEQCGGDIKFLLLETKSSTAAEARAMFEAIQAEGSWACAVCFVDSLVLFRPSSVLSVCYRLAPFETWHRP